MATKFNFTNLGHFTIVPDPYTLNLEQEAKRASERSIWLKRRLEGHPHTHRWHFFHIYVIREDLKH